METPQENILEKYLAGINLKVLWAIIISTALCVSTVLTVYHGFNTHMELMQKDMDLIKWRLDRLENNK